MMTWGPQTAQEPTANGILFSMGITYISGFVPISADRVTHLPFFNKFTWLTLA